MNPHGASPETLARMQKKARLLNRGKRRTDETKRRMSEAILAKKRAAGVPFCPVFNRPLFKKDGRWALFLNGKKMYLARALYEKFKGTIATGHVIHHIDGNPLNDSLDNLVQVSYWEHVKIHDMWFILKLWTGLNICGRDVLDLYLRYKHARNNFGRRDRKPS